MVRHKTIRTTKTIVNRIRLTLSQRPLSQRRQAGPYPNGARMHLLSHGPADIAGYNVRKNHRGIRRDAGIDLSACGERLFCRERLEASRGTLSEDRLPSFAGAVAARSFSGCARALSGRPRLLHAGRLQEG